MSFWDDHKRCFDEKWIDALRTRSCVDISDFDCEQSSATTFIIPAGGGDGSVAFVSVLKTPTRDDALSTNRRDRMTIVGLATTRDNNIFQQFRLYMTRLFQTETLARMRHGLVVEYNYGGRLFAARLIQIVRDNRSDSSDVISLQRRITTREKQRGAVLAMMDRLRQNQINFAECLVTLVGTTQGQNDIRNTLVRQMSRLHEKNVGSNRVVYSGKTQRNDQDTLAFAFILCCQCLSEERAPKSQ